MGFLFDFSGQVFINEALQKSFLSYFHLFFVFLSLLDTTPYYLTVCGVLRVVFPRKISIRYIYLLSFVLFTTTALKHYFNHPRPGHLLPHLDLISTGTWFGFPSGAAMGALVIAAILYRHLPSLKGRVFAFSYLFFMCLSRLYLGAHFAIDVAGGLVCGVVIWAGYLMVEGKLKPLKDPMSSLKFILASLAVFAVMYALDQSKSVVELIIMLSGFSVGRFFATNLEHKFSIKNLCLTIGGLYVIFLLTLVPFSLVKILGLFLVGLWLSSACAFFMNYFSGVKSS